MWSKFDDILIRILSIMLFIAAILFAPEIIPALPPNYVSFGLCYIGGIVILLMGESMARLSKERESQLQQEEVTNGEDQNQD